MTVLEYEGIPTRRVNERKPIDLLTDRVVYHVSCQLQIGGDNPARESSFDCEFTARRLLLETWLEQKVASPGVRDDYLDDLTLIATAGYLDEYVAAYFGKRHWELPFDLETAEFRQWRRSNLRGHRAQTRIVGSWNYAHPPLPRAD